jgi:integrase/recombinase XerD
MTALADHLVDYLRLRRALGFQLGRHGEELPHFVAFLDALGAEVVTVELAVAWARSAPGIKPITVDYRLGTVRGFARYLHAIDPAHQIPPAGLLSVPRRRPTPYIYTAEQLGEVLDSTERLQPPLRAATYRALSRADVDLDAGVVTVRHAKFDRVRLVPLHSSVTAALGAYASTRDRLCPEPGVERFFVSVTGRGLRRSEADRVFGEIAALIGLRTDAVHARVHDMRHAFAVHTLIDGHRDGADISALLPVLSTYLGHVEPANTYWYLSAVPELMQLVAARLEDHKAGAR